MSLYSTLYGSGAGAPIGTVVASVGAITDPDWVRLDNGIYLKADYPDLDTSKLLTFEGQSLVTGPTITARTYRVNHISGTIWYAHSTTDNVCARSTDNGATWSTGTLPGSGFPGASGGYWHVSYVNGLFFYHHSGTSYTTSYYTSTDGLSWTLRSLPTWGSSSSIGGIGYINGRYVAAPGFSATSNLTCLYSADGITWTVGASMYSGSGTVQTNLPYGSGGWTLPISKATGLHCGSLMYSGGTYTNGGPSFWTVDGVNFVSRYHKNPGDTSTYYIAPSISAAEDAFGNLSDGTYVFPTNSHIVPFSGYKAMAGFPLAKSNLHSSGAALSEDHGLSIHRTDVFNGTSAFSGSRLLSVNTSGVVSWADISATKFRAARAPGLNAGDFRNSNLYIKAR